jgi:hypothetical protein
MLNYAKENPRNYKIWLKWRLLSLLPGPIARLLWQIKHNLLKI